MQPAPNIVLPFLWVALAAVPSARAQSDRLQSYHTRLASDVNVGTTPQTIHIYSFTLANSQTVLLTAEGRLIGNGGTARLRLHLDGNPVGNESTMGWDNLVIPLQHSFACLAAATLTAGNHTVSLIAGPGPYTVGAHTNLSVMVAPAAQVTTGNHASHANFNMIYDFDTAFMCSNPLGYTQRCAYSVLPHAPIAQTSHVLSAKQPTYVFAAGWKSNVAQCTPTQCPPPTYFGDVMWSIFVNGVGAWTPNPNRFIRAAYTVNDSNRCADLLAPMYCQAVIEPNGNDEIVSLTLDGTEFPNCGGSNDVRYRVDGTTTLVALTGGMSVHGASAQNMRCTSTSLHCSEYLSLGCRTVTAPAEPAPPCDVGDLCSDPSGPPYVIVEKQITIPSGHDGIVYFSARAREQAGGNPPGQFELWIEIDGTQVGSWGVQQLGGFLVGPPPCDSAQGQRTMCASYLAAGSNRLSVGNHLVRVFARAQSYTSLAFMYPGLHNDDPILVWID